jgi:zinc transport system substrate-binding protein
LLVAWLLAITAATGVSAHSGAPRVVVTIKPIHSLVSRLMQGVGEPVLLVEGAASPHTFALKPSGVRAINEADVFIRVSPNVEPFTRRIVDTLPESVAVVTLIETPGLTLLPLRGSGPFDPHAAASGHAHQGGNLDDMDGHIWLDPENAKIIVASIADVLAARAPAKAEKIKANAKRLREELDALSSAIAAETQPLREKPFIVFHDAYQYFEHRFALDAVGSITVSPEAQPSAKRLTDLRHKIRTLAAVCVFSEPLFQPNLVAAVTEDTKARSGVLDPEGSLLAPGGELYFKLMQGIAGSLKACLERPS